LYLTQDFLMDKYSYISNAEDATIDALYQQYLKDPNDVEFGWRKFFEGFEFAKTDYQENGEATHNLQQEFKVINLIHGYRGRGHLFTKTNPVRERRTYRPTLDIENFGLRESDLDVTFQAGTQIGLGPARLRNIVKQLQETYCQSIGSEFMYIRSPEKIEWLLDKIEGSKNSTEFSIEEKRSFLKKLNQASAFENFLHTKFVGQKRFSLEGSEAVIPALDALIEKGADIGVKEFILGMAHRGRLNVLANIFGKTYKAIFKEFEGIDYEDALFDGDVKYHLGYACDQITDTGKKVHLMIAANPSHLEAVDPVVEGISRAKIELKYDGDSDQLLPILIHGDASIAGQGIMYELVQMAGLDGYQTGGTVHIVINNQIGFTTNFQDGRSSTYCTDVGKVTLCPIFHVNGDDVEAVVHTMRLAMEYRQKFHQDVFIDLLCYRKYGHNEGDEPRFTQPLLYKAIAKHPSPRQIYSDKLMASGVIEADLAKNMEKEFKDLLQERLAESKEKAKAVMVDYLGGSWKGIEKEKAGDFDYSPDSGVAKKQLIKIADKINVVPQDKKFFKKLERILLDRQKMVKENKLDWGMAELLAYGSLLEDGHAIRFSGQDVERGTFSHRHAVLKIEDSEEEYIPLNNISEKQAKLSIYNSLLSEYGVLGFDYGYSLSSPNGLTIWEAQFGDFSNGAQIIIDQFISSAEDKWKRMSGLVMLLPHGYEGMGAEHSSARMERYLQLGAENNMQMVNCTTPGNFFHVLRRQMVRNFRKPLIVFTPKKLLRYPRCVSSLDDLSTGGFQEIIDDELIKAGDVKVVALCSGKIYYDLLEQREKLEANDIALVRIEQLFPFPEVQFEKIKDKYKGAAQWLWVQEEPENMGAWTFILRTLRGFNLELISREASASPAAGTAIRFESRQKSILNRVFSKSGLKKELVS